MVLEVVYQRLEQLAALHEVLEAVEGSAGGGHDHDVALFGAGGRLAHRDFEVFDLVNRGMLAIHRKNAVADLGCGRAGQQQQLYVVADRLAAIRITFWWKEFRPAIVRVGLDAIESL